MRLKSSLLAQTMERFGRLDVLVNNAGAFDGGPIDELSVEKWDRVVAVNLRAPFFVSGGVPDHEEAGGGHHQRRKHFRAEGTAPPAAYSATKHGLWGLTQVTALEGREYGIIASCLHPETSSMKGVLGSWPEDREPMMQPEELAQVAVLMAVLPPHINMSRPSCCQYSRPISAGDENEPRDSPVIC